jgi:hypothetical protein
MKKSAPGKLQMYLAVKAVCAAKPALGQGSPAFQAAFVNFCAHLENLIELQPTIGIFRSAAPAIAAEAAAADRILTAEMDELIERYEAADVAFVDAYTAARSMDFTEDIFGDRDGASEFTKNQPTADRGRPTGNISLPVLFPAENTGGTLLIPQSHIPMRTIRPMQPAFNTHPASPLH